jgi:hypothetical protein
LRRVGTSSRSVRFIGLLSRSSAERVVISQGEVLIASPS